MLAFDEALGPTSRMSSQLHDPIPIVLFPGLRSTGGVAVGRQLVALEHVDNAYGEAVSSIGGERREMHGLKVAQSIGKLFIRRP